jgi:hypothetical protein
MASAILSGAFRVSNSGNIFNRAFDTTVTVSTWQIQQLVIANGVSDTIVSLAYISIPNMIFVTATSLCRINYSGHASNLSAASAGWNFKDMWAHMGSGMSGPTGLHFANSSGDSATITLAIAM